MGIHIKSGPKAGTTIYSEELERVGGLFIAIYPVVTYGHRKGAFQGEYSIYYARPTGIKEPYLFVSHNANFCFISRGDLSRHEATSHDRRPSDGIL